MRAQPLRKLIAIEHVACHEGFHVQMPRQIHSFILPEQFLVIGDQLCHNAIRQADVDRRELFLKLSIIHTIGHSLSESHGPIFIVCSRKSQGVVYSRTRGWERLSGAMTQHSDRSRDGQAQPNLMTRKKWPMRVTTTLIVVGDLATQHSL